MRRLTLAAALFALPLFADPALAREPTAEERAGLETALRAAGYSQWEEIEFDDGVWEIDDARHADGREYGAKIDPNTMRIISREED